MNKQYDKYYQTEKLFGEPYPELIKLYSTFSKKGKLLDLGCGQGRDAIALARLGFEVTGIDNSRVGIEQLNKIAKEEMLPLTGTVEDIYSYSKFNEFDFILLDSMFHFGRKERAQETKLLEQIIEDSKPNTLITICIQKSGEKVKIMNSIISTKKELKTISKIESKYKYEDKESNHSSETIYEIVTVEKI